MSVFEGPQSIPVEKGFTNNSNKHVKNQILNLLSLKRGIFQYESDFNQLKDQQCIPKTKESMTAIVSSEEPYKKKKNHRKLQSKLQNEIKLEEKRKTQSERVFKKRQIIENNKKQLLRGSENLSQIKPKMDSSSSRNTFKNKFNSIQFNQKQASAAQTIKQRAQTISHAKMAQKRRQQNEVRSKVNLQSRLKTFTTQYKSNYHLERVKMKEVDEQHKNIEALVKEITNNQFDFNQDKETKEDNDHVVKTFRNSNLTQYVERKMYAKARRMKKEEPLKGLLKDRYKILNRIGKGLSGQVYKGKDILSDRFVAIKVSELSNNAKQSQYQFYKKVQHRNIVNYLNNFTENNKRYLILQYFPYTLESLSRSRKFTEEEVKKIFKAVSSAIMFLHSLSIAHRDIKLQNIVCDEDLNNIKFIDFGLCIDMNDQQDHLSKQFCGTMHYMPPEILQNRPYEPKNADIWSLGVVLYKLSFDRFPFRGKDEFELLTRQTKTKLVFSEHSNSQLKNLLERMLTLRPISRLTIGEVMEHRWMV